MKKIVLALLTAFVFSCFLQAQDEKKQRTFQWFPAGNYEKFLFRDFEAIGKEKFLQENKDIIFQRDHKELKHLPAFLVNDADRLTYGKSTRIKVVRHKAGTKFGDNKRSHSASPGGGNLTYSWGDNHVLQIVGMGDELFVIESGDLSRLLSKGVSRGDIYKTEEKLYNHTLYKYDYYQVSKGRGNKEYSYIGVVVSPDQFVMASSQKALKKMLDTHYAGGVNILDDPEQQIWIEYIDRFSYGWTLSNQIVFEKAMIAKMKTIQALEESAEWREEMVTKEAQYSLFSSIYKNRIGSFDLGIYSSDENAKWRWDLDKSTEGMKSQYKNAKLENNTIFIRNVYDEEAINRIREFKKAKVEKKKEQ